MKLDLIDGVDRTRVLGIDPATTSLAFTLVEGGVPTVWGKELFYRKSDQYGRFLMIPAMVDIMMETCDPTSVFIEQMVFVRNQQTLRILSYMVGAVEYEFAQRGFDCVQVPPMTHKSYHGYTKVTDKLVKERGWTKKDADKFRKSQIQDKLAIAYPGFNHWDNDVADSASIALMGAGVSLKEVVA